MDGSWDTAVWFQAAQRSYKGILNISLIEASLKVLVRWYYVPSRLARIFPGSSPVCFRGCELEGSMLHIWWSCPRIRAFWQKMFRTISALTRVGVAPHPSVALLNQYIPNLPKSSQTLSLFILLGAKMSIAKAWKKPRVPFQGFRRKVSWIMMQEQIVDKLHAKLRNSWQFGNPGPPSVTFL